MSGPSYVILEWNQAGGTPRLADNEVYDDAVEAAEVALIMTKDAAPRKERYTVHELYLADRVGWRECPDCKGKGALTGVGLAGQQDADCGSCKGGGVQLLEEVSV